MHKTVSIAFIALVTSTAQASDQIDLTGTYAGSYTCEGTFGGFPFAETFTFEAQVIQHRHRIRLSYLDQGSTLSVYAGVLDEIEPGANFLTGILQACGGDFEFEELLRINNAYEFEEDEGATASFDGTSLFGTTDFPKAMGELEIDTCKYAFNRVSRDPGRVAQCQFTPRILTILDPDG